MEGPTLATNKAMARRVLEEIFPANDVVALRDVISEDFVNHEAPSGTRPGLDGITMFMRLLNDAFSDQRWEIHDVIEEDDKVVLRCTHSGVHTGDFFGLPATGRSFAYRQITSSGSPMARASSTGLSAMPTSCAS